MNRFLVGTSFLSLAAVSATAHAQVQADNGQATPDAGADIIVTGTRQIGTRAADSAAPIQVIDAQALTRVGQPDLVQALQQNVPSFNAETYGQDSAAAVLTAALRGLNPNDTLILIDGKRRHGTSNLHVDPGPFQGAASADLGLIPVASIDHIEVLTDGAAAQYGTDAIAGVVNIILKKSPTTGSIELTGGQYFEGDGKTGAGSINKGFALGDRGFVNVTLEDRYHDHSVQGGADSRFSNLDGSLRTGLSAIDTTNIPLVAGYPNINRIYGDNRYNLFNALYDAGYMLSDAAQLYSTGTFSARTSEGFENYRRPSRVSRTLNGVTTYPFPFGFSPLEKIKERDFAFTGGIKGTIAGWNYDLSSTYGRDRNDISTIHSANASLYADTGSTPTSFYDGAWITTQWTNNLDLTKGFDVGLATPVTLAIGAEVRRDTYQILQGDAGSTYKEGGQSYPGFQATDAGKHSRTNVAGYADLALNPVTAWHIDVAGRYEHYSDAGNATVGKFTTRYDFSPAIAIRGTVSTGFRAPTLAEQYYSATNVAPSFAVVNLPPNSGAANALGFGNLRPEKSTNYSAGFVVHPTPRAQITVDAYQISIRDRIINTGTLLGLTGTSVVSQAVLNAIAARNVTVDPSVSYVGIALFTNGVNTRTRGVEATASYASDFDELGHVDWNLGVSYNDSKITRINALPASVTNAAFGQTAIISPESIAYLTTATPRVKVIASAVLTQLDNSGITDEDRVHLHYALGKSAEDARRYREAFAHYATGARLRRGRQSYSPSATSAFAARIRESFDAPIFARNAGSGCPSNAPIFIVGLPRSGSTLVEQILASHSQVEGTMELPDIGVLAEGLRGRRVERIARRYPDAARDLSGDELKMLGETYLARIQIHRSLGTPHFVDKMPNNFHHVGLIQLILPDARIIDARRHPLGVGFAVFKQLFASGHPYSYDLEEIGRYYRDYVETMRHFDAVLPGRVHRLIYEDLIDDTTNQVRALLDYCGLPFENACLNFYRTERAVRTVSSEQVRQPIFLEGVTQWRNFEAWLEPLKAGLAEVLDLWRN